MDDGIRKLLAGLPAAVEQNVVPFGKYKGQPVEVLRADQGYFDWAYAQEGIRRQHPWIFNVQYGEPSYTPEHNRYQVMFLDQSFIDDVWDIVRPGHRIDLALSELAYQLTSAVTVASEAVKVLERRIELHLVTEKRYAEMKYFSSYEEQKASGVLYYAGGLEVNRAAHVVAAAKEKTERLQKEAELVEAKAVLQNARSRLLSELMGPIKATELAEVYAEFEAKEIFVGYDTRRFAGSADVQLVCAGHYVRIDIKPSMGDDYPAVLRQMKAADCNVLYLVNYDGEGATLNQVVRMFASAGIIVLEHAE